MNEQGSISWKNLQKKWVSRRNLIRGAAGTGAGLMLSSGLRLPAFAQEAAHQTRGDLPHPPDSISNPSPTVSSLSLSCAPQGKQAPLANGQLLVNGQNFVVNSVVRWNGNNRPTTFHSSNKLTAQILASDIATIGTAVVTVFNPAPGGRSSNSLTLSATTRGVGPQSVASDPTGKFEEGWFTKSLCILALGTVAGSVSGGGFLSMHSIWAFSVYLTTPTLKDNIRRQPGGVNLRVPQH